MHVFWIAILFLARFVLAVKAVFVLEDTALPPVTGLSNREVRIFKGNSSFTDYFHQPHFEDNYFLIGARNVVFNISLSSLNENKRITWYSSADDIRLCQLRQKSELECQNYMRVIAKLSQDEYLICGTNAFRPLCRTYRPIKRRAYTFTNEESGVARCPYDPAHNSTAVYIEKRLYSATVADLSARDSLIFSKPLRTEQHDSQWLNDPNFVSSFAHDGRIYFFFRETAVENINCGKVVFSRVARVCTRDIGGSRVLRNTWTSFFKARLNCSIPGEFPFYFDEIQSTSDLGEGNIFPTLLRSDRFPMVYALFSTSRNSLRGTAVCAYKFSDIVSVFEGAYKEQRTAFSNWLPVRESDVPEPHPAKSCPNDSQILSDQTLNFIKSHPLMDKSVPSFGGQPIIIQTSLRFAFTQIAIDWQVHAADQKFYNLLFIGTDDGRIVKAFNKGNSPEIRTVLVEILSVFPDGAPITSLKIAKGRSGVQTKLVAVSRDEIRAISLHRCSAKATCSSCVALKDPYCSWVDGKCAHSHQGLQNLDTGSHSKCPPDPTFSSSTSSSTVVPDASLCQPCVCKESSILHAQWNSNSPKNDSYDVSMQKVTLGFPLLQKPSEKTVKPEEKMEEDDLEENEIDFSTSRVDAGSSGCVEDWGNEAVGYPLFVLLLVAFLSAAIAFFVGVAIGCFAAGKKCQQFCRAAEVCEVDGHQSEVEKVPYDDDAHGPPDRCNNPLKSDQRYKVVVNELKANNSKQPNGSIESSIQKANLNFL